MFAIPKIRALNDLVTFLEQGRYQEVLSQISDLEISADEVQAYIFWDKNHYTRNCIKRTEEFELLLLCWEPGQGSAIHSHNEQECWVKIIDGSLRETVYEYGKETLKMSKVTSHELENTDISNMSNNQLFHSMANTSSKRAISLHLYMKPITNCEVYNSTSNTIAVHTTRYHSIEGQVV